MRALLPQAYPSVARPAIGKAMAWQAESVSCVKLVGVEIVGFD